MQHHVARVEMEYFPLVSVNRAYVRNNPRLGHKEDVDLWLTKFKAELNKEIGTRLPVALDTRPRLELSLLWRKKRGRIPDADNFVKLPKDIAAICLGIDDWLIDQTSDTTILEDGDNWLVYTLHWSTPDRELQSQEIPYSAKSMGPLLSQGWITKLKLQNMDMCIGYGSAYCMTCEALEYCPEYFDPSVYEDCPCKKCDIEICPCRGNDPEYEERKKNILRWWKAKGV